MCPLQEIYRTCKNGMSSINHVLQEERKFHFLSSGRLYTNKSMDVAYQTLPLNESSKILQPKKSTVSPASCSEESGEIEELQFFRFPPDVRNIRLARETASNPDRLTWRGPKHNN